MLLRGASALIYVERRGLMEVFSDDVKKVWKRWEVQVLIVFSLCLQVVLTGLGHRRKYLGNRTRTRFLIWSAYLLADWVATVALGVISQDSIHDCKKHGINGGDPMDELKSFWASFLLLHLGGPDTITAYALEDNELWLRHLVGLVIQTGLALYILLVAWPGTSWLPALSLLIFAAGLTKYCERTLALMSANIENLRDSMLTPPESGPNYPEFMAEFNLKKAEGYYVEAAEVKELPVRIAHSNNLVEAYEQFQTFKRLFVDLILSFQDKESSQSYFQTLEPDNAFEVVEVELGFAFDLFYTKAPIVYTVAGCILRVFSFSCTFSAFVVFPFLSKGRNTYHKIDLIITYLLLVVAILLEIYAVMTQINSDWTDYWLHKPKKNHENMSRGSGHQGNKTQKSLISGIRHPQIIQRWSNLTAQYNLLSFCLEERPPIFHTLQKLFRIDQIREKHRYKTYEEVSPSLKSLIFNHLKKSIAKADCNDSFFDCLPNWKNLEFDQRILILHIATDICYYLDTDEHPRDVIANCRESKQLSDYMLYLLVLHPFMLPIGIGMIRFRDTCAEAKEFFHERGHKKVAACKKLLAVNTEVPPGKVKGDRSKSVLFDACILAKSRRQIKDKGRRWDTISGVWVEILGYAARHCRGNHHAQQLRKGGELLTHVWLLMAHLGITEHFQINQGHARAKLVRKWFAYFGSSWKVMAVYLSGLGFGLVTPWRLVSFEVKQVSLHVFPASVFVAWTSFGLAGFLL